MFLKGFTFICISVGLALFVYNPLPDGMENPYRANIILKVVTLIRTLGHIGHYLGYGSMHSNIWQIQKLEREREPVSATYGDLTVTRDTIVGVPVIIYQPKDISKLHPGIIYFHGGGWSIGSPDFYDRTVYDYANKTGTVMFNVGYRLAPEHPYPAALQDSFDVTSFVLRHGARYNVDVRKVGVAGDSAGGNLAAAVSLKLLQEKTDLPKLLFQVLHYPVLQALNLRLPSYIECNRTLPILTIDVMCAFFSYYLGLDVENTAYYVKVLSENRHIPPHLRNSKYVDVKLLPKEYQTTETIITETSSYDVNVHHKIKDIVIDPLFAPLLAPDLTGLPPTFIHTCEFDILRDDAYLFARRLQDAGVKVEVYYGKGGFHSDILKILPDFLQSTSGKKALSAAYAFIDLILKQ